MIPGHDPLFGAPDSEVKEHTVTKGG